MRYLGLIFGFFVLQFKSLLKLILFICMAIWSDQSCLNIFKITKQSIFHSNSKKQASERAIKKKENTDNIGNFMYDDEMLMIRGATLSWCIAPEIHKQMFRIRKHKAHTAPKLTQSLDSQFDEALKAAKHSMICKFS